MRKRMAPSAPTDRHQVIISADLIRQIDDWRRKQPDIPNKSEAIRRLIEQALSATAGCVTPAERLAVARELSRREGEGGDE